MSTLIIVESPTKAKTISKFLGPDYTVRSSFGHVRDLPKSKLGVDVKNNFTPQYLIPAKAKPVIKELQELVTKSERVILATDEDREGEAIAWHLVSALDLESGSRGPRAIGKTERIVFHEITAGAIKQAIEHPRELDLNLVDAQQARRILDRLVGYELSPFLWRKIRYGLSAGRVQSVALRLIVEREREITAFTAQEYWSIEADLSPIGEPATFRARLIKIGDKTLDKFTVSNQTEADKIITALNGAKYKVGDITEKEVSRNPAPPFTTSTLQQEAARKLGLSAKQTMMIAQKLYETGFITYMRTDSLNLAETARQQAQAVIKEQFGPQYTLAEGRHFTNRSKGAQEAHEAIRPTDLSKLPSGFGRSIDSAPQKLYDLIWKRTLASQMPAAIFNQTSVDIHATRSAAEVAPTFGKQGQAPMGTSEKFQQKDNLGIGTFRANGQVVKFDGFIRAYTEGRDDNTEEGESDDEARLPKLSKAEALELHQLLPLQHFTEPPPRYTDATLIKALEVHGIGRPSTYAPTLATIQEREYVEKIDKRYHPSEIGILVNDMLVENFPEIVDINFTSHIEEEFDQIAEGKIKWVPVIEEFYTPFKKHLVEKEESVEKVTTISTTPCPHCGKMMIVKFGRMGKFLACPEEGSKITQPLPEEAAEIKALEEKTKAERCPICGKDMTVKRGRFGYFLGCVDYPKCKGVAKIWNKLGFKCPSCLTGEVVERKSRGRGKPFYSCNRYPDCTFITNKKPTTEAELQEALAYWKANPPKPRKGKTTYK